MQNIIFRFSDKNHLLVAVPQSGLYFGHPLPFNRDLVPKLKSGFKYNIIANHLRLNNSELKSLMPSDTKLVTILREPNSLFDSLYNFYNLKHLFGVSFEHFLAELYSNSTIDSKLNSRLNGRFGRNQMSFDLGLNVSQFEENKTIDAFIERLDATFDLVLISDRMDESLVLLRHHFCWSVSDVVVFRLNARKETSIATFGEQTAQKLRRLNGADHKLYRYFSEKLDTKIEKFGFDRMKLEVEELKKRTNSLYEQCVDKSVFLSDIMPKGLYYSPNVKRLKAKRNSTNICEKMTAIEAFYVDLIRQKQIEFYDKYYETEDQVNRRMRRIEYLRQIMKT